MNWIAILVCVAIVLLVISMGKRWDGEGSVSAAIDIDPVIDPAKAIAITLCIGMVLLTLALGWWVNWNGGWD